VFMDWHMPGMDGLEASRLIKQDPALQTHPALVMVTAFSSDEIREEAERLKIDGFLLKPVTRSMLVDTLVSLFAPATEEVRQAVAASDAHTDQLKGVRVLVAEDNLINQQIAMELLESAGVQVDIGNTGKEAVDKVFAGGVPSPYDAVFMDLQMPEMDGYQATARIRADPRFASLPIIAMTAHALVEERQHCLDAGMNDHVSKPIDPDALFTTLSRWARPKQPFAKSQTGEPAGNGSTAAPRQASDDVAIPDIAGIDAADGLRRLAGNRRLYRNLLEQFAKKQGEATAQIAAALESGDRQSAERIAHTVKGVAGNLGIKQMQACAERLERALRENNASIEAPLGEFGELLRQQVTAIERALPASALENELNAEGPPAPFNGEAAASAVARLKALLEASDGDSSEAFAAVAATLAARVAKPQLDALGDAINDFDFDRALASLGEIARDSGLEGGHTS
jgi:CheY-like chemotaxis protein/HPt (histidine-containing phosphotransfer) domain-containing protein